MRASWFLSFWLGTLTLVLLGCRNTGPELKPPKGPEVYNLPPANDPQYDKLPATPPDPNNAPSKSGGNMGQFKGPGAGGMMGGGGGGGGGMMGGGGGMGGYQGR